MARFKTSAATCAINRLTKFGFGIFVFYMITNLPLHCIAAGVKCFVMVAKRDDPHPAYLYLFILQTIIVLWMNNRNFGVSE